MLVLMAISSWSVAADDRQSERPASASSSIRSTAAEATQTPYMKLFHLGHQVGKLVVSEAEARHPDAPKLVSDPVDQDIKRYSSTVSASEKQYFFIGRYDRSRARLPENVDAWRASPNIGNPGPDLANWPNSAFTLPEGRAYIEFEPLSYSAQFTTGATQPAQYAMDFLLRYGLTDDIELRVFGNGPTWTLGNVQATNFAPLAFDTKIHVFDEREDLFLPAMGIEAYIQTEWLGSTNTNSGTQPSINLNFDQSLPWEIDFEYNLGAVRTLESTNGFNSNVWELSFQWSLQRDFFEKQVAFFIHGYFNAPSLPRVPNPGKQGKYTLSEANSDDQNVVGAGFIWTVNSRLAVWGQNSFGTNSASPSMLSNVGLALAF